MSQTVPPDLPHLTMWISRIAADYERIAEAKKENLSKKEIRNYRRVLHSVGQTCAGGPSGPSKDQLRELIAAGAVSYASHGHQLPPEPVPEQLAVDLAVYSLWPIVQVPTLPNSYFKDLTEISSEPIARLVAHARLSRSSGSPMSALAFGRALTGVNFAPGLLNLLNDLADPRRGGCAFTAIMLASTGTVPERTNRVKTAALWVLMAAAAGVIGNRADDILTGLVDWLSNPTSTSDRGTSDHHSSEHSGSYSEGGHNAHHDHHHGGSHHQGQGGEGLARIVEDFIDGIFR